MTPELNAMRARIRTFLERRPDLTFNDLAAHTGLAQSTCLHFFNGGGKDLAGGFGKIEREFARVLDRAEAGDVLIPGAAPVRLTETHPAKAKVKRARGDLYATETVRLVSSVLSYCADHAMIGVVAGDYGVGKTESVKIWRRSAGRDVESLVFEFDAFTRSNMASFIEKLADALQVEYRRGTQNGHLTMDAICAHLQERPALLIFDQCETVQPRVMEVIRQIHDRTREAGCGVVLLAAPILFERMQASRVRDLGAMTSRVGVWVSLRGLSKAEMADVLKREGITDVDEDAFDLWWRAVNGSMRRLINSAAMVKEKHEGRRITEKTVVGVASHLWGMAIGGRGLAVAV